MSTPRDKIFGMDLGVDPKIIVLALIVIAGVVYFFTSSSSSGAGSSRSSASPEASIPVVHSPAGSVPPARLRPRRARVSVDRDTLKLVPVDGSRGDIDPTLRLGLLERVKNVSPASGLRNLFEAGAPVMEAAVPPVPKNVPILQPKMPVQIGPQPPPPPPPVFNIPLKYYGFAKSKLRPIDGNRGLFLDGDNILIGGEGDTLEKRYLIVALTPSSARLEDVQAKQRQDLPVTPEAPSAQ